MGVTSLKFKISVFNITKENRSFLISIPGHWNSEDGEELNNKLNKLIKIKSENDIDLHVKEVEKGGTRIEKGNSGYNSAGFDHFEGALLSELKRVKYRDVEDIVYGLQLTYDEIVDILVVKNIAESTKVYTLPPSIYKSIDID